MERERDFVDEFLDSVAPEKPDYDDITIEDLFEGDTEPLRIIEATVPRWTGTTRGSPRPAR